MMKKVIQKLLTILKKQKNEIDITPPTEYPMIKTYLAYDMKQILSQKYDEKEEIRHVYTEQERDKNMFDDLIVESTYDPSSAFAAVEERSNENFSVHPFTPLWYKKMGIKK
jgi:hypothetical protein